MNYTLSSIRKALGYKLMGNKFLKAAVCETIAVFPEEIIDFICKHVWFVGSFDDGYGFTLRADEIKKGEYLIFLSDELFNQDEWRMRFTIAHEIGHVILGHRNSIGIPQSKAEVRKQERQANAFAKRYLG